VGNTGFGYGDEDLIGYSERLSLLFTEALGRDLPAAANPSLGESLARAKRLYVQTSGPSSLSPIDEKVLTVMNLYGLPFITVQVPNQVAANDPTPLAFPAALQNNAGTFTRIVTITSSFSYRDLPNGERVPQTVSTVEDSLKPGQTTINSTNQMATGLPVLPSVTYDISMLPNPAGVNAAAPLPRGVELLAATSSEQGGFRPHVTTPITEEVYSGLAGGPGMAYTGLWLPDLPYGLQRLTNAAPGASQSSDRLVLIPAQFQADNESSGRLRSFEQMVLLITYVDPARASEALLDATASPQIDDVALNRAALGAQLSQVGTLTVGGRFTNQPSANLAVSVVYTIDGRAWKRDILTQGSGDSYSANLSAPPAGGNISAIFQARNPAGYVAAYTEKGRLSGFRLLYLPIVKPPQR
jgi:hypothetical protein